MSHKRSRKKRILPRQHQQQSHSESTSLQHELEEFLEQEVEFRRTHDHGEEGADERLHHFIEHLEEDVIHTHNHAQPDGQQTGHVPPRHKQSSHEKVVVPGALSPHAEARVVNGDKFLIGGTLLVAMVLGIGLYRNQSQVIELPPVVKAVQPVQPVQPSFVSKVEPDMPLHQMMVKPELAAEEAAVMADEPIRPIEQVQKQAPQAVRAEKKSDSGMLKVTANLANIRTEPHTDAKVLYRLEKGTEVRKIAVIGGWYRVRLWNGAEAWAHESVFE